MKRGAHSKRIYILTLVFIVFVVAVYGMLAKLVWGTSLAVPAGVNDETPVVDAGETSKAVELASVANTRELQLVNRDHRLKTEPQAADIVDAWPTVAFAAKDVRLDKTALNAVDAMFDAARQDGIKNLFVSSGYRDKVRQRELYDEAADKSYVQPAGYSEHETGLAADILATGVSQDDFASTPAADWLAKNSWKYGFIQRYPAGEQASTGISYESWHYRYIGLPHARYCVENHLTFEEYIVTLKNDGGYSATVDGKKYDVVYETPKDGKIRLPKTGHYSVSSDNTGGYIVTAWR